MRRNVTVAGAHDKSSATLVVLCLLLAASTSSAAEVTPLLASHEYVALQVTDTLYLLDRSGPLWFVFRMREPVKSFRFIRREARSGDAEFSIDGRAVRFVRFKGVLVFAGGATVLSRKPSFDLRAVHARVNAETWWITEAENHVRVSHASADQTRYEYTLASPKR